MTREEREKQKSLNRYRDISLEIERMIEERAREYSKACKITPVYTDMPKQTSGDNKLQRAIEKLLEEDQRLAEKITEYLTAKREIEAEIETVEDEQLRCLLRYRYIDHLTWEKIAEEMHYSVQHTYKLHIKALEKIKCDSMRV